MVKTTNFVFDLNGTLIDSSKYIFRIFKCNKKNKFRC